MYHHFDRNDIANVLMMLRNIIPLLELRLNLMIWHSELVYSAFDRNDIVDIIMMLRNIIPLLELR